MQKNEVSRALAKFATVDPKSAEILAGVFFTDKEARFEEGEKVDVGQWLRSKGYDDAAKKWDEHEGEIEELDKDKEARFEEGEKVDVGQWLRSKGYDNAAKKWDEHEGEIGKKASDKIAMSLGKEIFRSMVDLRGLGKVRSELAKAGDKQSAQLLRDAMETIITELEPKKRGVQQALNRMAGLTKGSQDPASLRNQIFKIANELGMRLPSAMFASTKEAGQWVAYVEDKDGHMVGFMVGPRAAAKRAVTSPKWDAVVERGGDTTLAPLDSRLIETLSRASKSWYAKLPLNDLKALTSLIQRGKSASEREPDLLTPLRESWTKMALMKIHQTAAKNPNSKLASIGSSKTRIALAEKMAEEWIEDAIKRPGRVHRYLGIPEDKDIPMSKLDSAIKKVKEEGTNPSLLRALQMAKTLKGPKVATWEVIAYGRPEVILSGDKIRLSKGNGVTAEIVIEELPSKPLKSRHMKRLYVDYGPKGFMPGESAFLASNLLQDAKIKKSDTYDQAKKKLEKALEQAGKAMEEAYAKDPKWEGKDPSPYFSRPHESTVHYLQVEPKDYKPMTVKGKDFSVSTEWGKFKAYDPDADFQSHDPSYTLYESKSPAAARKFYKMLKANPGALKNVTWSQFSDWLNKNKVPYNTRFSVYR